MRPPQAMGPAADQVASSRSGRTPFPASRRPCSICCAPKPRSARFKWRSAARGGGGGAGGGAGRDLASLFDLELDTEKNQYETAQTAGGSASQRAKDIDDALQKLDRAGAPPGRAGRAAAQQPAKLRAALAAGNAAPRGRRIAAPDGADGEKQQRPERPKFTIEFAAGKFVLGLFGTIRFVRAVRIVRAIGCVRPVRRGRKGGRPARPAGA